MYKYTARLGKSDTSFYSEMNGRDRKAAVYFITTLTNME